MKGNCSLFNILPIHQSQIERKLVQLEAHLLVIREMIAKIGIATITEVLALLLWYVETMNKTSRGFDDLDEGLIAKVKSRNPGISPKRYWY